MHRNDLMDTGEKDQQLSPVLSETKSSMDVTEEKEDSELERQECSISISNDLQSTKSFNMDVSDNSDINTQAFCDGENTQFVAHDVCMNEVEDCSSDTKERHTVSLASKTDVSNEVINEVNGTVNNESTAEVEQLNTKQSTSLEKIDESIVIECDEETKDKGDVKESNNDHSSERNMPDNGGEKITGEASYNNAVDNEDLGNVSQASTVDIKDLDGKAPPSPEDLFASQSPNGIMKPESENSFVEYEDFIPSSLPSQNEKTVNEVEERVENVSTPRKRKFKETDKVFNENKMPRMESPVEILQREDDSEQSRSNDKDDCSNNEKLTVSANFPKNDPIPMAECPNKEIIKPINETEVVFKEPVILSRENRRGCSVENSKQGDTKNARKSVEIIFSSVSDSQSNKALDVCAQDLLDPVVEENGDDCLDESDGEHMRLQISLSPTQATQSFSETVIHNNENTIDDKLSPLKRKSCEISSNGHNFDSSSSSEKNSSMINEVSSEDANIKNDSISVHETSDIMIISPEQKDVKTNDDGSHSSDNELPFKSGPNATDDVVILDENNDETSVSGSIKHKDVNGLLRNITQPISKDNSGKLSTHEVDKSESILDGELQKHPQLSNLLLDDRSTPDLPLLLPNKDNSSIQLREMDMTFAVKCHVQINEESHQVHSIELYQCHDIESTVLPNSNNQESSSGYVADESKNSSPSSVVSVGPFPLRAPSWRLSSSSSSTVSSGHSGIGGKSRNSDWPFTAPLKPAPGRSNRGRNFQYSSDFSRDLFELVEKKIHVVEENKLPCVPTKTDSVPAVTSSLPTEDTIENDAVSKIPGENLETAPETPRSTKKLTRGARNTRNASRNLVSKIKEGIETEESSPQIAIEKDATEITGSAKRSRRTPVRASKRTGNSTPSTPVIPEDSSTSVRSSKRTGNNTPSTPIPEDTTISATTGSISRSRRNRNEPTQNEKTESSSQESLVREWDFEGCFSKLVTEAPVFARWTDKRYYPGRIKEKTKDGRWIVEFDDKTVRPLKEEFIIPVNILTKGQIVYAFEEEEYEQGIIVEFKLKDGEVHYGVDLDSGGKLFVPRSKLFMTEDQARLLQENMDPKSPTTSSPALTTVSCDNIVHHKRPRSNRVLFGAAESPSGSGVIKTPKRSGKVDPSHDTSCSSSVSDSNDKGTPLVLEEVTGVDPEVPSYFPESLPTPSGRGKGPGRIKSKTRTPRRNVSNISFNENQENKKLFEMLGPIPEEGSKMFSGMCFLLTHSGIKLVDNLKNSVSSKSRKKSEPSSGSEHEDVSTDDGVGVCKIPFVKDHLKRQIEAGGGIVFEQFEDLPEDKYQSTFLVSERPCLTAKFILCLLCGIRIIHHPWIIQVAKGFNLPWTTARLQAGWDLEGKRYIAPEATIRTRKQKPLNRKEVGVVNDSQAFVKFWGRVLELLGASVRHITPEQDSEFSGVDVIVTDSTCPPEIQERAREWSIPLVSSVWVTQSLINWRIRSYTGHPHYRYDYCTSE